jgi:hypothetical protein
MYRLGNIHLRLEHVTVVFPVRPLLGHDGVHGFDVMIGGYVHTAKYLDVEEARRSHAALLRAIDPPAAVAEPSSKPVPTPEPPPPAGPARKAASRRGKNEPSRSRH